LVVVVVVAVQEATLKGERLAVQAVVVVVLVHQLLLLEVEHQGKVTLVELVMIVAVMQLVMLVAVVALVRLVKAELHLAEDKVETVYQLTHLLVLQLHQVKM
jgi:hypothetical protein